MHAQTQANEIASSIYLHFIFFSRRFVSSVVTFARARLLLNSTLAPRDYRSQPLADYDDVDGIATFQTRALSIITSSWECEKYLRPHLSRDHERVDVSTFPPRQRALLEWFNDFYLLRITIQISESKGPSRITLAEARPPSGILISNFEIKLFF